MQLFSYWFWPNPAGWRYTDFPVQTLLAVCAALIILSFVIGYWRKRVKNPITKNLSKSWSSAALWFGLVGIVFVVSRVEMIQFLAMRAMWALWLLCLVAYAFFQFIQFRRRHYTVMQRTQVVDEREKYLPGNRK
ncbi:MAG: hypothetical protein KBA40_02105 [Candidatus Peribacteraceae bacterium]|nr:hypothetical protein [Candidatus Peribacteraceae bacterium]